MFVSNAFLSWSLKFLYMASLNAVWLWDCRSGQRLSKTASSHLLIFYFDVRFSLKVFIALENSETNFFLKSWNNFIFLFSLRLDFFFSFIFINCLYLLLISCILFLFWFFNIGFECVFVWRSGSDWKISLMGETEAKGNEFFIAHSDFYSLMSQNSLKHHVFIILALICLNDSLTFLTRNTVWCSISMVSNFSVFVEDFKANSWQSKMLKGNITVMFPKKFS